MKHGSGIAGRTGFVTLLVLGCLALAPAAQANIGGGSSIVFSPSVVHVGDGGTATIGMINNDQDPDSAATNTVCNAGDSCPTTGAGIDTEGISVIPTCQALVSGTRCGSGSLDPDVYALASVASGVAGTACAGTNNFRVTRVVDSPDSGRYNFTPFPLSNVTLAGNGARCLVTVTYTVLKTPRDAKPATPNSYETISITSHQQINPFVSPLTSATLRASDASQTVLRATPSITTNASPAIVLGSGDKLSDTAKVSGLVNPITGAGAGTVEFRLYLPADTDCSDSPTGDRIFTGALTLNAAHTEGTAASSPGFTPTQAGTYRWRAFYSGDANNDAVSGACNIASENTLVRAAPSITTNASPQIVLGSAGTLSDTATVSGLSNPVTGAGAATVEFRLYLPGDTDCSNVPTAARIFTSALTLNAAHTQGTAASSPGYTPTLPGTYRWRAFYSGDTNNAPVSGPCNAANENTEVLRAAPTIETVASPAMKLGSTGGLTDTATVSSLRSPVLTGPERGTVEFRLYLPGDENCLTSPTPDRIFTSDLTAIDAQTATATSSPAYTPTMVGTYRWRAFYSGDANNQAINGPCNAANESTAVRRATPTIATVASPTMTLGSNATLSDVATLSGLENPILSGPGAGTVEFRLYLPGDETCSQTPTADRIFTSALTATGEHTATAATSPGYTPTMAGVYRWRAFYSGDATNDRVSGACNEATENTVVAPAAPSIATVASPDIVLGAGTLTDSATVSGLSNPVIGAGTVEFRLYRPGDPTCVQSPLTTSTVALTLNAGGTQGTATSAPPFTPTVAGVHRWRAFYSGDDNNSAVSGACNVASENVTVLPPATPTPPAETPPPPAVTPPPVAAPPPPVAAPPAPVVPRQAVAPASISCTTAPGSAPAGTELCARGTAAIHGRTGCQGTPFRVSVTGRDIQRVTFVLDGRVVRTLLRPNTGRAYVLPVNPRRMKTGLHRVQARTIFNGRRPRTLRVAFSRCSRRVVQPAFTG